MSEALGRPEDQRSDWEQRVAGAARWWSKASSTPWPAEVLVGGMSALECLVLKPGESRDKGVLVADRVGAVAVLPAMTESAQIGWLRSLYKRRSEALHAGHFHQDDLDAMNFLTLVGLVLPWAVEHLDSEHRGSNGP